MNVERRKIAEVADKRGQCLPAKPVGQRQSVVDAKLVLRVHPRLCSMGVLVGAGLRHVCFRGQAEEQIRLARESVAKLGEQGQQTRIILTNVQQQAGLARQALEALSVQSRQTGTILTNVELQEP